MAIPTRWQMKDVVCDAYEASCCHSSSLHGHHHFLLTLILSGSGIQILNGQTIPFGPNDVFLLSPADFHQNVMAPGESFAYYGVKFPYELLDSRLSELCALDKFPMHLHLSNQQAQTAKMIFGQLVEECQQGSHRLANKIYLQSLVEQLFIFVLRQMPADVVSHSGVFINKALGFLYSHFSEPITVSEAATFVGYTPNYFNTCFREQMGVPFGVFLRQIRINYAENLLRASGMSITEIALESGFGSLSHFSRSFREKYNISAQAYRKTVLEKEHSHISAKEDFV